MMARAIWWDRSIWWRTYRQGGYDGYRTLAGRRLPCATMETALRRPDMKAEIRRLAARRPRLTVRREFLRGVHIGAVLACIIFAGLLVWTVLQ